jgi:hypothetical protein
VVGEGARGAAVTQPASSPQDQSRWQVRAFTRDCSPAACVAVIVADAPGVRHLADELRQRAMLPPELTAALFGFALGLIVGIALSYPSPKDRP